MKLYAEQIQSLRKRKKELLRLIGGYAEYCSTRECDDVDNFGYFHFNDSQADINNSYQRGELADINYILLNSEFMTERNFDMVDIGTTFYADFGDDDVEKMMLVDSGVSTTSPLLFVSVDSDFGKAILGKKVGDEISYKVEATGRSITASVKAIDTIKDHYLHFICEEDYYKRKCQPALRELRRLKEEDYEEYYRRQAITLSQVELLEEELYHVKGKDKRRYNTIINLLKESNVAPAPTGDTIQVGSIVEITLVDGDNTSTHQFEFINRAVSTEIEGDYVERISTLGDAIYGKRVGDTFSIPRKHMTDVKGVVTNVFNHDVKRRVR